MSISSRVIVQGSVASINTRSGIAKASGNAYSITTALVVGEHTLAEVRVPDHLTAPAVGQAITAVAVVDVYQGDDSISLSEYIETRPVQKAA